MIARRTASQPFLNTLLTSLLAGIFLLAAVMKLLDLKGLYQVIFVTLKLPQDMIWPLGQAIVAAEILIVLTLSIKYYRLPGLIASAAMSLAFLMFSGYRLIEDMAGPCHCFGDLVHLTPLESCVLDATMLAVSLYLLVRAIKTRKEEAPAESSVYSVAGVLMLLAGAGAAAYMGHQSKVEPLALLNISPSMAIGHATDSVGKSTRYTVVMFGDYQCPPCKAATKTLAQRLRADPTEFKLMFRNFPLAKIHPFAKESARVAEQARLQGKFWPVHDALYAVPNLNGKAIADIAARFGISPPSPSSEHAVKDDVVVAKQLGFHSTPSFVLIDENGDYWKTSNLAALEEHLD